MTLIATVISRYGIIQASDSNLTSRIPGEVTTGPKVFKLGFTPGALALAGTYSVGSEPMGEWLTAFIDTYGQSASPSLAGFARELAAALESSPNAAAGRMFHIAGYVADIDGAHPEFYFVRNIGGIHPVTGNYQDFTGTYDVSEDFWSCDYLKMPPASFAGGANHHYFNGFTPGRIAYLGAVQLLRNFYQQVWSQADWEFRRPESLQEIAEFARLDFHVVNTLFLSSDYPSPYIGGDVQIEMVPAPLKGT